MWGNSDSSKSATFGLGLKTPRALLYVFLSEDETYKIPCVRGEKNGIIILAKSVVVFKILITVTLE